MSWLSGLLNIPGLIKEAFGLASKGLDYYLKKADGNVQIAIELMKADQTRINAQRDVMLAGMNHPIWWMAWGLFVFPVGFYHAAIFIKSTLNLSWTIQRVPAVQEEWALMVVTGLVGLQVGSGIVASVINRVTK